MLKRWAVCVCGGGGGGGVSMYTQFSLDPGLHAAGSIMKPGIPCHQHFFSRCLGERVIEATNWPAVAALNFPPRKRLPTVRAARADSLENKARERKRDRDRESERDRQTDRQTETDTQITERERQRDRDSETETERA